MPYAKSIGAKSYDFGNIGDETKINYSRMIKIVKDNNYKVIGVEYEGNN